MSNDINNNNSYTPPKVWQPVEGNGGKFANTNRPTAGARQQQTLPVGDKPLQLYSLNTPNGIKVNILLEELAELGIEQAAYDAYKIDIMEGDQFGSDFVDINPNSKIPALVDYSDKQNPVKLFESGAILTYLAQKFDKFIPKPSDNSKDSQKYADYLSWSMWQMASAPYVGGGFGHFFNYAPYPMQYPIDRFTMETKRQLDVLDQHLADNEYMLGDGNDNYSIVDMLIWPWYGRLALDQSYERAGEFLQVDQYSNLQRWAKQIAKRPAVQRAVELELTPLS
ncbi:glutathione-dependent disulfide-bond oxidoreductase [Psychrobacter sp. FDAARGOS_221]|uniref:glutathione-dependent disulfide-bond oxidoreductase n=1 Tax=Psychrobacter sp. FDAARGOS_221 TaxID=1975705 RepID=UPI000BB56479|nr:glutathione-dependent disulfide-bond oxidoreductase [Psychrobacter sp. FDAARGOS_221]PNK59596.1 glutathione-dependent disulfide-bond oxidoreductase [Psychrobacter sp. FDAARGOS_221]